MANRKIATLVLVAVLGLATVALVSAATRDAATGIARFREMEVAHTLSGDYGGATETWRTRIFLLRKQQTVGTGVLACVRVEETTSIRECQGTVILPRGRIQLAGEIINRNAFQLSIVAGSGTYEGMSGVAVFLGPTTNRLITFYLT